MQAFVQEQPISVVPGREVDPDVTNQLIEAIEHHTDKARIIRAIAQYNEALKNWSPRTQLLALAHLFMGVEAAKDAVLRKHLEDSGQSEEALAISWGYDPKGSQKVKKFLLNQSRVRLLFRDDEECHQHAKKASDGFEHGFTGFEEIVPAAQEAVVRTAEYLRRAVIELSGIGQDAEKILLSAPFTEPRGPLNVTKYLKGRLVCATNEVAALNNAYPFFEWRSSLKDVWRNSSGKYTFSLDESHTGRFSEDVQFKPIKYEIWDGSRISKIKPPEISE